MEVLNRIANHELKKMFDIQLHKQQLKPKQ